MFRRLALLPFAAVLTLATHAAAPPGPARDLLGEPLPAFALARLGTPRLFPHSILDLAFTPDARALASVGGDGVLRLHDVATGRLLWRVATPRFYAQTHDPSLLSFSPDGKLVALGCADKRVRLWNVADGRLWDSVTLPFQARVVRFAPDGRRVAAGGDDDTVQIWDSQGGGSLTPLGDLKRVRCLAYRPSGKVLVTVSRQRGSPTGLSCDLWSLPDGELRLQNEFRAEGEAAPALSPDGRFFAVLSEGSKGIGLYDAATGRLLRRTEGERDSPAALAFSGDGRALAAIGPRGPVRVYDTASGKQRHSFPPSHGAPHRAALSSDGKLLALSGRVDQAIHLWDLSGKTPRELLTDLLGHRSGPLAVAFSADGKTVLTVSRDGEASIAGEGWSRWSFRRWQPETGRQLAVTEKDYGGKVYATAVSPDGRHLAAVTEEGGMRLWDVAAGKELRSWRVPFRRTKVGEGEDVREVTLPAITDPTFSPDGKEVLAAEAGSIRRWAVDTGKPLDTVHVWEDNARQITRTMCVPSPDGETLLLTGWTRAGTQMALVGAAGSPREELVTVPSHPWTVAFTPDGRTLAVPGGSRIQPDAAQLIEVATGRQRGQLAGVPAWATALAVSRDGRFLACGGDADVGVRVWRLDTGEEVRRFDGHEGRVLSLSFSPDGSRLASAGSENTAIVWDVRPLAGSPRKERKPSRGALDGLWSDLAGADAERAYRAVWDLAAAAESVPFVQERLRAVLAPDEKKIGQLIAGLDDELYLRRQSAEAELQRLGMVVEAALERTLKKRPPVEMRLRVESLLGRLRNPKTRPPAVGVIALRVVEVLEKNGTAEARKVIAELARGPKDGAAVRAAQGALRRLEARGPGLGR